jgi:hypothetical protein
MMASDGVMLDELGYQEVTSVIGCDKGYDGQVEEKRVS